MKNLIIVDDRRSFWSKIALRIAEVNADVKILTLQEASLEMRGKKTDMLVLGEDSHIVLKGVPEGRELRIVVTEGVPPGKLVRGDEGRYVVRLGWPAEMDALVILAKRMLSVSYRWPFADSVLVASGKAEQIIEAESEDLSMTGMAFRSPVPLEDREEVSIALRGLKNGDRLLLDAQVVRSEPHPNGGGRRYGVRFLGLSTVQEALERFLSRLKPPA